MDAACRRARVCTAIGTFPIGAYFGALLHQLLG